MSTLENVFQISRNYYLFIYSLSYLLKRDFRFDTKRNGIVEPETEVTMADVYNEFDQKIANRCVLSETAKNNRW